MYHDKTCFWCGRYTSNVGSMCFDCSRKTDDVFELRRQAARQVSLIKLHQNAVRQKIRAATGARLHPDSPASTTVQYNMSRFWGNELRGMIVNSRLSERPDLVLGCLAPVVPFGNGTYHGNLVFKLHAVRGEGAIIINAHGGIGKQEDRRFAVIWSNGFTEQHMQETR